MQNHRAGPRRVQYDAKAPGQFGQRRPGGPPGPGGQGPGGRMGGPGGPRGPGGMRHRGIGSFSRGKGGTTVTKERSAHKKVVRIEESVFLQGLAGSMGVKATDVLRKLFQLGMTGININSTLDADTAKIVAGEFGWEVEDVAVSEADQIQAAQGIGGTEDNEEDLKPRPPVVSVMGHVDHGKTSLLDALRKTNVVSGEAGGITQHIGAYSVKTPRGLITFLDTPGHEAFTAMRMRGAQATDITVLVVAADDGVMPQTKEAVNHARAAGVPIVVAINKCDKPEAQPERVRRELSELGLVPEEWGGETLIAEVSAHTKVGIDDLLDRLLLQAEMLNLRANPDKLAAGIVVEAQLDRGKGPLATVLVTEGTLRSGDVVLAGAAYGKIRAMHDSQGVQLREAGPSMPAALIGLSEVPRAGDQVYVMKDLKTAQEIAESRKTKERRSLAPSAGNKPRSLEEIAKLMAEQEQMELKVIIKSDVAGSAEAVSDSLLRLTTDKVKVTVVHSAAGAITENDVNLAVAAGAIIIGFNARPAGKAAALAQQEGVEIRQYSIIYNVVDEVKLAMEGLLAPKLVEKDIGKAEVRQTFRISKSGTIAGCMVIEGAIKRGCQARLIREGKQIWEGKLVGLKRFKDDAKEVKEGFECGISLDDMEDIKAGDIISAFEIEQVKQKL
jgi:translation initiation factor IF-2